MEWKRAERIELRRYPEYWGFPPYLDGIVFRSIPENSTRFFELLSGSIHMMDGIPPDDVQAIAAAVLRHRLLLIPEVEVEGRTTDSCVEDLLLKVEVPR